MLHAELMSVLAGPSDVAARRLLGCHLVRELPGPRGTSEVRLVGRIVETEAYDQHDAASHSFKGRTPRTDVMFGPPGHLYVYFTYGMHYCCNVVTGPSGEGAAVLIRAVEPLEGQDVMSENRSRPAHAKAGGKEALATAVVLSEKSLRRNRDQKIITGPALTNGPAKLCQAFAIDKALNGHDLSQPPLTLVLMSEIPADQIVQTTRIGISQAKDAPLRFFIKDNQYVYC